MPNQSTYYRRFRALARESAASRDVLVTMLVTAVMDVTAHHADPEEATELGHEELDSVLAMYDRARPQIRRWGAMIARGDHARR